MSEIQSISLLAVEVVYNFWTVSLRASAIKNGDRFPLASKVASSSLSPQVATPLVDVD
jgi:hypothetical protein